VSQSSHYIKSENLIIKWYLYLTVRNAYNTCMLCRPEAAWFKCIKIYNDLKVVYLKCISIYTDYTVPEEGPQHHQGPHTPQPRAVHTLTVGLTVSEHEV
jgi:hypothetical protein